jgi:phage shock protein PspC (stress-responsive transcriptional regulator)
MAANDYRYQSDRFKRMLGTSADKGWVFGVCPVLAKRFDFELWAVRLTAIICLLLFTLLTVVIYFVVAMVMDETRPSAQRKLKQWAKRADSLVDTIKGAIAGRSPYGT